MFTRTMPALLLLIAACGAPDAGPMVWSDLTDRERPTPGPVGEDVITQDRLVGDIWVPTTDGPHPVVVMIHGGCWQKDIADRSLMDWAAGDLRDRGMAVWNIEYRGVDEAGGGYPGTFADVRRAAALLGDPVVHEQFDLDMTRVAAFGHSAGGHLALWLAASARLPDGHPAKIADDLDLRGVVSTGGLADLAEAEPVTLADCLADVRAQLTGPATDERPDPYADTSPDRLLPLGVTQISIAGEDDPIAPPSLAHSWTAKARAAGDDARTVIVPGGHVELISPGSPAWSETVRQMEALLAAPSPLSSELRKPE